MTIALRRPKAVPEPDPSTIAANWRAIVSFVVPHGVDEQGAWGVIRVGDIRPGTSPVVRRYRSLFIPADSTPDEIALAERRAMFDRSETPPRPSVPDERMVKATQDLLVRRTRRAGGLDADGRPLPDQIEETWVRKGQRLRQGDPLVRRFRGEYFEPVVKRERKPARPPRPQPVVSAVDYAGDHESGMHSFGNPAPSKR